MFEELNFDKDFYSKTSQEELLNWYNTVVIKNVVTTSSGNKKMEEAVEEVATDEDVEEEVAPPPVKKPAPKQVTVTEQSVKQKPQPAAPPASEDVDLDDIMGIIDSIGK
jgi:predicted flap endonuclease-1-like 5' DNA nuclease